MTRSHLSSQYIPSPHIPSPPCPAMSTIRTLSTPRRAVPLHRLTQKRLPHLTSPSPTPPPSPCFSDPPSRYLPANCFISPFDPRGRKKKKNFHIWAKGVSRINPALFAREGAAKCHRSFPHSFFPKPRNPKPTPLFQRVGMDVKLKTPTKSQALSPSPEPWGLLLLW